MASKRARKSTPRTSRSGTKTGGRTGKAGARTDREMPERVRGPLLTSLPEPSSSPTPLPSDHLRLLVELLKPGVAELARRWVAALLVVPEDERAGVVASVERRMIEVYGNASPAAELGMSPLPYVGQGGEPGVHGEHHRAGGLGAPHGVGGFDAENLDLELEREVKVVLPPVQRDGYVEQVERRYGVRESEKPRDAKGARKKNEKLDEPPEARAL